MDFQGSDVKQKWKEIIELDQVISGFNALCQSPRSSPSPQADLYREKLICSNGGLTEEIQTLRQQSTELEDTVNQLRTENESLRVSSEDLKTKNEHLRAESSKLKKENERLRVQLGIQIHSEEATLDSQCLRVDFVSKTSELVSRHKEITKYFTDRLKIMNKLHQSSVHSLETFERELKQWKEGLTTIDANLAKSRHRSGLSDPEEWSDDDDHTKLNESIEECARMIEELDALHEPYIGFQCTKSGHLQQPVPPNSVTVVRSNVSKQDCEACLHKIELMTNEFVERQRLLEKLYSAERFPKEEKGKFKHIRKHIEIGEVYEKEVKSVEETGKQDVRSLLGTSSAVQRSHEQEEEVKTVHVTGSSVVERFDRSQKTRSLSAPVATAEVTAKYLPQESVPLANLSDSHTYQSPELAQNEGLTLPRHSLSWSVETITYTVPHPKTVQAFLEFYKGRILSKMEVVAIKRKLFNVGILPECLLKAITDAKDTYEANSLFFQHAMKNYHFTACVTLCDTMMIEKGYPQMNRLGNEMWKELESNQLEYQANDL